MFSQIQKLALKMASSSMLLISSIVDVAICILKGAMEN
uniref:Uncharacterized protein n=1 Tax=Rhizophora mucronata TaxID=61149 RepID=A0A2P2N3K9_RHIMU